MQNFVTLLTPVALQEGKRKLCYDLPGHLLWHICTNIQLVGVFTQLPLTLANDLRKVPSRAELHDYVQLGSLLIYDPVVVASYVWMPQLSEDVDLRHKQLLFSFTHGTVVDLLPDKNFPVLLPANPVDLPEAAFADLFNDLVLGAISVTASLHNF